MTAVEETLADLWATGTWVPIRSSTSARRWPGGVLPAAEVKTAAPDSYVVCGGLVTHREALSGSR